MQIRGLPGHVIRNALRAARLLDAKTTDFEAARRRDAIARWQQARRHGLTAGQAAKVIGCPLSTLYRWAKDATVKSRRPKRARRPAWATDLVPAVEEWRLEEPMWGKARITVKLKEQGFSASEATVGRILAHLVKRGAIVPVPALRKAAGRRKWPPKRRFAQRLPKAAKASRPGQIVQLDTLSITLAPGKHVKHFTAYDASAKWTTAKASTATTPIAHTEPLAEKHPHSTLQPAKPRRPPSFIWLDSRTSPGHTLICAAS